MEDLAYQWLGPAFQGHQFHWHWQDFIAELPKLPLNNCLPVAMVCNALLLAFFVQPKPTSSEMKVVDLIFGLVGLHRFLVGDLLSGLAHHQSKQIWSIVWVLHLLNFTIKQCLDNANEKTNMQGKANNLHLG